MGFINLRYSFKPLTEYSIAHKIRKKKTADTFDSTCSRLHNYIQININ